MVTNFVKASYKELYDIATTPNKPTMVGIHTPTSVRPVALLQGFWAQYKRFKYLGCKVAMVPVHSRPLDIQQIGTQAGLNQTNPKDLLNPVLSKGYIGESLGYFFDQYFNAMNSSYTRYPGSSADLSIGTSDNDSFKQWYYQNLVSKGWRKTAPTQPLLLNGLHPRLWALGVNHPIQAPINHDLSQLSVGSVTGLNDVFGSELTSMTSVYTGELATGGNLQDQSILLGNAPQGGQLGQETAPSNHRMKGGWSFMTYRTVPISWQDTIVNTQVPSNIVNGVQVSEDVPRTVGNNLVTPVYSTLDKHFMAVIILPPSETTVQYWRLVVSHYYAFKGFRFSYINAPGRGSVGNAALPIADTSANNALLVNQPVTVNWPEDTSNARGVYNVDGTEYETAESGTLDVINGSVEFVSDTVQ